MTDAALDPHAALDPADPATIAKAARIFDHMERAKLAGKGWWARTMSAMIVDQIAKDRLAREMLRALEAMVLNDAHTYRDCHKAAQVAIAKARELGVQP